jgi:hypothetical protein
VDRVRVKPERKTVAEKQATGRPEIPKNDQRWELRPSVKELIKVCNDSLNYGNTKEEQGYWRYSRYPGCFEYRGYIRHLGNGKQLIADWVREGALQPKDEDGSADMDRWDPNLWTSDHMKSLLSRYAQTIQQHTGHGVWTARGTPRQRKPKETKDAHAVGGGYFLPASQHPGGVRAVSDMKAHEIMAAATRGVASGEIKEANTRIDSTRHGVYMGGVAVAEQAVQLDEQSLRMAAALREMTKDQELKYARDYSLIKNQTERWVEEDNYHHDYTTYLEKKVTWLCKEIDNHKREIKSLKQALVNATVTDEDLQREFPEETTKHARLVAWQLEHYPEPEQSSPMPQYSDIDDEADFNSQSNSDETEYAEDDEPLLDECIDLQQDSRNTDASAVRRYKVVYDSLDDKKKNTSNYKVIDTGPEWSPFPARRNRPGHLE